ncbi:MAG: thiol:disulfide interchange protein [Cognaticolwellia sp.]|jgi:thiol:disulfide interchange protein
MRQIISTLIFSLIFTIGLFAQTPTTWKWAKKDLGNGEYLFTYTATISPGWVTYSMLTNPDLGPTPTEIAIEDVPSGVTIGKIVESSTNRKKTYDKIFDGEVVKFHKKAVYTQKIKVSNNYKGEALKGYIYFMTCNDEKCMPPAYIDFTFKLDKPQKIAPKPTPKESTGSTSPKFDNSPSIETVVPTTTLAKNGLTDEIPVDWKFSAIRVSQDEYEVNFDANIKEGYYIYSQFSKGSKGPMPTAFNIDGEGDRLKTIRRKEKGEAKVRKYDNHFKMTLTKFADHVTFTKKIKLESGSKRLKGQLYYIACSDDICLPPKPIPFSVYLPKRITKDENAVAATEETPMSEEVATKETTPTEATATNGEYVFDMALANSSCSEGETQDKSSMSLLLIFLAGFGGGLVALLTPCVFPMLPLTVAFFTKQSKTKAQGIKNAVIYGLSIIGIYVGLGLAVTGFFGPDALNLLSTNAIMNLIFFALFVIFALSFFGLFEIQLPNSWANRSDEMADKGGLIGIFFMAFTLALVSFSCTGPIIGTLLVEAARGGGPTLVGDYIPLRPLMGMFGFSLALALPFTLFAAFPGWLNTLPKSGGWMNTVKISIGVLELALALKFLSVADLAYGWNILPIELFLGAWIVLFGILGLYLLGIIKFKSDSPRKTRFVNPIRAILGIASLAFVGYLVTGFNYKPLSLLSGLAPPTHHSWFQDKTLQEYPDCPNGIRCFKDYDEALAYAKEANLPLMIDFTGHGCVNCRKVEETVWINKDVKNILAKDYVLVSLYVDERKKVDTYMSPYSGKKIRDVGGKWADFQAHFFDIQSQPLYVLVDNDGTVLHKPIGYKEAKDAESYVEFLECGLNRREALSKAREKEDNLSGGLSSK